MLQTLKENFMQMNMSNPASPTKVRHSKNSAKSRLSLTQSQHSCYELKSNYTFYQNQAQIEEDDLFKFNCHNMHPHDIVSMQLVTNIDDLLEAYGDQ